MSALNYEATLRDSPIAHCLRFMESQRVKCARFLTLADTPAERTNAPVVKRRAPMTPAQRAEIVALRAHGMGTYDIAAQTGWGATTVCRTLQRHRLS